MGNVCSHCKWFALRGDCKRAETTLSRWSQPGWFVPEPRAIAVFTYAQTIRSTGEMLPVSEQQARYECTLRSITFIWPVIQRIIINVLAVLWVEEEPNKSSELLRWDLKRENEKRIAVKSYKTEKDFRPHFGETVSNTQASMHACQGVAGAKSVILWLKTRVPTRRKLMIMANHNTCFPSL